MLSAIRSSWTLFIGIALIMLGNGLQGTLLGVRASLEGFSTMTTGLVMTGYFVGFLAGSKMVPELVRNVGHVRVFAALASLASISVLVHAVFVDPTLWITMRLITGFSYAGLYIVAESWLNEQATNETRGQLLSVYMITTLGGMAGGQLLLNLSEPASFELFVLISMLVSLSLVPISLMVVAAPKLESPEKISLKQLYDASPLGVTGALGTGLAHGVLFGMGAVYATQSGLDIQQVAFFMMSAILGGMILQWPVGWLSDRIDRRHTIILVSLLASVFALLAAIWTALTPNLGLLVIIGLFGGMTLPLYSLCIAHTNDHLQPEQMVAASGSLVMVGGIGAAMGPLTASLMMNNFGPGGFLWWLMIIHATIGLFALYRMTRRAAMPLEDQGAYVPMAPRASPVAAVIAAEEAIELAEDSSIEDG